METFKVKDPAEGSFLFAGVLLWLAFCFLILPPTPQTRSLFWKRKREKEQKGDDNFCFFLNDALLSPGKEKHL